MTTTSSLISTIGQHKLFSGFSEEEVGFILDSSTIRKLEPGDVLIHPGKRNNTLFLLLEGELRVILEKEETRVSIPIYKGECLGEMSLVMESLTSALAVSHTKCQVLAISEGIFWEKMAVSRRGVKNMMALMAERLHRNNNALIHELEEQLKYKQLEKDLETAGKIQANIVPDGSSLFSSRPEIDVYARMKQAREVGGDFYDAMSLDQDHVYFAIGDATGKGMPAALLMMRAITSLRLLVNSNPRLEEVVPVLNRILAMNNDDMMFVSLWAGILNVRSGMLEYVNGGHNPPFAAPGGSDFKPMKLPDGPIIGVIEDARFEVARLKMEPGDTIFLYTDGLPEAMSPKHVAFGYDRIGQVLNEKSNPPLKTLVQTMEFAVEDFVQEAPTHDDLTMMVVQYRGGDRTTR